MKTEGYEALASALEPVRRILLTTHIHPDGDAIGSVLALRNILTATGRKADLVVDDEIPQKYRFLVDGPVHRPDEEFDRMAREDPYEMIIYVDASSIDRAGSVEESRGRWTTDGAVLVNIDHHAGNDGYGDVVILEPDRASSGELVLKVAAALGVAISPAIADQLFAAVLTDTGRFQFSNADPPSFRAAAEMVEAGADPSRVAQKVYFERPAAFFRLLGRLFSDMERHLGGRICLLTMPQETVREFSPDGQMDTEGIVDFTVQIEGVQLGAFLRQTDREVWRASLRSRGSADVREVAEGFGGGGHAKAAGCEVRGGVEEVKKQLLDAMEGYLE
ncbi:MAG: DHH family phosphoesterase [bacterium]